MRSVSILCGMAVLLSLAASLPGQTFGEIAGEVRDPSGSVIAGSGVIPSFSVWRLMTEMRNPSRAVRGDVIDFVLKAIQTPLGGSSHKVRRG